MIMTNAEIRIGIDGRIDTETDAWIACLISDLSTPRIFSSFDPPSSSGGRQAVTMGTISRRNNHLCMGEFCLKRIE